MPKRLDEQSDKSRAEKILNNLSDDDIVKDRNVLKLNVQLFAKGFDEYKTVKLPKKEYGKVMHIISTDISKEERQLPVEAKFMPNNLLITDIELFGNLQLGETLTFTASTEGGNQPYQWKFCFYKEDQICYSNNNTSINFCEWLPTETGSYTVVVNVTDASNFSVSYSK